MDRTPSSTQLLLTSSPPLPRPLSLVGTSPIPIIVLVSSGSSRRIFGAATVVGGGLFRVRWFGGSWFRGSWRTAPIIVVVKAAIVSLLVCVFQCVVVYCSVLQCVAVSSSMANYPNHRRRQSRHRLPTRVCFSAVQ